MVGEGARVKVEAAQFDHDVPALRAGEQQGAVGLSGVLDENEAMAFGQRGQFVHGRRVAGEVNDISQSLVKANIHL